MTEAQVRIGVVGLGGRGLALVKEMASAPHGPFAVELSALCDTNGDRLQRARDHLDRQGRGARATTALRYYPDSADLIADPDIDVVMITTAQDKHEDLFRQAADAGKTIYCEKPLAASRSACLRMRDTNMNTDVRSIFGLTRRYESSWIRARQLVTDGAIGDVQMVMLRSMIPFDRYFHAWHRRSEWSGGLLNEKGAHHFDVLNWFADASPTRIVATGGRRVFAPRKGYPLRCRECDRDCAYRVPRGDAGSDRTRVDRDDPEDGGDPRRWNDRCVYAEDSDIIDHAAVTVEYANGVIGTLALAVYGQRSDDQESLEIVGDAGRIILTRHSGQLDLIGDHGRVQEHIDARGRYHDANHFGADRHLVREVLGQFARNQNPAMAGFEDAFTASMMSFAAQESIDNGDGWHSLAQPA